MQINFQMTNESFKEIRPMLYGSSLHKLQPIYSNGFNHVCQSLRLQSEALTLLTTILHRVHRSATIDSNKNFMNECYLSN